MFIWSPADRLVTAAFETKTNVLASDHAPHLIRSPQSLIVSSARAVVLRRSAVGSCPFVRVMPADQTPRCCADDPMMACVVTGNASRHGALEASFGRGGRGGQPG